MNQNMTRALIRRHIAFQRRDGATWRKIAALFPGVPPGTLCRIANEKTYWPKSKALRDALIPPKPRRVYDLTNRQARDIAIKILGVLYEQAPQTK